MSVIDNRAAKNSTMARRSPGHRMRLVTRCDVDEAHVWPLNNCLERHVMVNRIDARPARACRESRQGSRMKAVREAKFRAYYVIENLWTVHPSPSTFRRGALQGVHGNARACTIVLIVCCDFIASVHLRPVDRSEGRSSSRNAGTRSMKCWHSRVWNSKGMASLHEWRLPRHWTKQNGG